MPATAASHERFKAGLLRSHDAVMLAARILTLKGMDVQIAGLHIAPTVEERHNYRDGGDMRIKVHDKWRTLEVKGLNIQFTSQDDWPFEDVCLGRCDAYDGRPHPDYYMQFSRDRTHFLWITVDRVEDKLHRKRVTEPASGDRSESYAVSKEFVTFHAVDV